MSRNGGARHATVEGQLAFDWHPSATVSTSIAAEMLGISQDMVLSLIHTGELEARRHVSRRRKTPGRRCPFRVYLDSIDRVAEEWRRQATAASP